MKILQKKLLASTWYLARGVKLQFYQGARLFRSLKKSIELSMIFCTNLVALKAERLLHRQECDSWPYTGMYTYLYEESH
jgi:hypothetical protein